MKETQVDAEIDYHQCPLPKAHTFRPGVKLIPRLICACMALCAILPVNIRGG